MARVAGSRRRASDRPTHDAPKQGAGERDAPPRETVPPSPEDGGTPVRPALAPALDVTPSPPDLLVVGRIGKPQGLRGEVTVQVRTDDPDARFAPGSVLLTDPAARGPLTVKASRTQNGRLVVSFEGVPDRTAAELLRETLLQVDAHTLPPPEDDDEFHDHVLRGLAVELVGGASLGTVADVLHLPHGDVLVVERLSGGEVLVPFVKAMVPVVDLGQRRLVVDPPAGLLDLDRA